MSLKKAAIVLLILSLLIPSLVLAKEVNWVMEDGNLEINSSEDTYIVTQNDSSVASSNRIVIAEGIQTKITLNGVNLSNQGLSPLDIGKDADVTLSLQGENKLNNTTGMLAALHISSGTLVIEGEGYLAAQAEGSMADGAGIGSHKAEAMEADIEISGKAQVYAASTAGASIGSGDDGDMRGNIRILEEANLSLYSTFASGLGAGSGKMSGSIVLGDQSTSKVLLGFMGAGIGVISGEVAESASITVTDDAELSIKLWGDNLGKLIAIGTDGDGKNFKGKISILEHAKIQSEDNEGNPFVIGGGNTFSTENESGSFEISTGATINGIKAKSAKILVDNKLVNIHMVDGEAQNLELVDSTPEPEPPTPPTPKVVPSITTVGLHTLHAGKVSVGPVGAGTTGLVESAMDPVFDLAGNVLYKGKLAFVGETPSQGFTLSVNLGLENAGKAVEILQEHGGQVSRMSVLANAQGLVSLPLMQLGNIAVIAK